MTVENFTDIVLSGTAEEVFEMLKVIHGYIKDKNGAYFGSPEVNGDKNFDFENLTIEKVQPFIGKKVKISLFGPYGYVESGYRIFSDMAKVAPDAWFVGEISGSDSYSESEESYELKDGLLVEDGCYHTWEGIYDAWIADVRGKLPVNEFVELFKVENRDFDEDSYSNFIYDCMDYDLWDKYTYKDFVRMLDEEANTSTKLTEDEFYAVLKKVVAERGIMYESEFRSEYHDMDEKWHNEWDVRKDL